MDDFVVDCSWSSSDGDVSRRMASGQSGMDMDSSDLSILIFSLGGISINL